MRPEEQQNHLSSNIIARCLFAEDHILPWSEIDPDPFSDRSMHASQSLMSDVYMGDVDSLLTTVEGWTMQTLLFR